MDAPTRVERSRLSSLSGDSETTITRIYHSLAITSSKGMYYASRARFDEAFEELRRNSQMTAVALEPVTREKCASNDAIEHREDVDSCVNILADLAAVERDDYCRAALRKVAQSSDRYAATEAAAALASAEQRNYRTEAGEYARRKGWESLEWIAKNYVSQRLREVGGLGSAEIVQILGAPDDVSDRFQNFVSAEDSTRCLCLVYRGLRQGLPSGRLLLAVSDDQVVGFKLAANAESGAP
jgi:hypothetical protein